MSGVDAGAARLVSGTGDLAARAGQLKSSRGANNSPEAGTGTAALEQALELAEAAASDPLQGAVPLAAVKDRIAKISGCAHKLDAWTSVLQAGAGKLNDGAA
ncbi:MULTISPECIES: hypothetical protein [unclassified Arthrobacter]|uniref:hypothetical protein n=1 Tax=unclassified Arthrobacter TaxID=235627 RepID=UPI00339711A5